MKEPKTMITTKINVTKIDKSALFEGKNGKYLDLVLHDNRDGQDQYGNDGYIVQDIGRERREAGERGPIIGNWRKIERRQNANAPQTKEPAAHRGGEEDDDIPF